MRVFHVVRGKGMVERDLMVVRPAAGPVGCHVCEGLEGHETDRGSSQGGSISIAEAPPPPPPLPFPQDLLSIGPGSRESCHGPSRLLAMRCTVKAL